MKPIPLKLFRSSIWGSPTIIELVEVYITNRVTPDLRFALCDKEQVLDGKVYVPAGFGIPTVRQSLNDKVSQTSITLPDVGDNIAAMVETAEVAGCRVMIKVSTDRAIVAGYSYTKIDAIVSSVTVEMTTVVLNLESAVADSNGLIMVPQQTYNQLCEYQFGGPWCTVDRTLHQYLGIVGEGSNQIRVVDPGFVQAQVARTWDPSYLLMTGGVNINQARGVTSVREGVIQLRKPFYIPSAPGDTFTLQRHCARTPAACLTFLNSDNYGGCKDQPEQPRTIVRPPIVV